MALIWDPRGQGSWRSRDGRWQIDAIKYPTRTVYLLSKVEHGTGSTVATRDSFYAASQEAQKLENSREIQAGRIYREIGDLERRLNALRDEVRAIERARY
jgi:hypothetical protein